MRTAATDVTAGLAFLAVGVVVALAVALPQSAGASPDPDISYVWRGVTPFAGWDCYPWNQFAGWHPCWHSDEVGEYRGIDYNRGVPYPTAGSAIYLDYSGGGQLFKITPASGVCKGVRAELYWSSYDPANYRGDVHYLHIDPNQYWLGKEVPNQQVVYIGDVALHENPDCEALGYWDAPHLHQSADVSPATPFYSNKLAKPTEDNEWEHAIMWEAGTADNDGDVWLNQNELYIGTDPFDNCPDNSSDAAWPPDIDNDGHCGILDVLLFKTHLNCSVGQACYDNRFDLNVDGVVSILDVLMLKPWTMTDCD